MKEMTNAFWGSTERCFVVGNLRTFLFATTYANATVAFSYFKLNAFTMLMFLLSYQEIKKIEKKRFRVNFYGPRRDRGH